MYDPSSAEFQDRFPFYWVVQVHGAYTLEMEKALKTVDLDLPAWRTLVLLKEEDALSVSDISLRAVTKLSSVTRTVYRMKDEGLVDTATAPYDARVTLVTITPAGMKALDRAQLVTQHIFMRSFEGLTKVQIARLTESLSQVLHNLSPRHSEATTIRRLATSSGRSPARRAGRPPEAEPPKAARRTPGKAASPAAVQKAAPGGRSARAVRA